MKMIILFTCGDIFTLKNMRKKCTEPMYKTETIYKTVYCKFLKCILKTSVDFIEKNRHPRGL